MTASFGMAAINLTTASKLSQSPFSTLLHTFYTTKGVGKGTGLGLPMVHGLAQQTGGAFELLSAIGAGTSAVLWLPVAPQEAASSEPIVIEMETSSVPRLRILAVDDDALVLINTVALLEDLGHEVVEADTAEEALELFRRRKDIDLLITDQAMPNMTGADLITAVDALRPGIPAIIASGYGEGVSAGRDVVRLSKPFNQGQLAKAIAEAVEPGAVPRDRTVGA